MAVVKTGREGIVMREIGTMVLVLVVTALIVLAGIGGKKVLFIDGARSAVITLGVVGMALCAISVGKFVTLAPAHPLSILGYLLGAVALLAFLTQIFQWKVPYLYEPRTALFIMAACMAVKTVVARFSGLLR